MDFPTITTVAPLEFTNHRLNFLYQTFKEFKATHRVGWDGLDHGFY